MAIEARFEPAPRESPKQQKLPRRRVAAAAGVVVLLAGLAVVWAQQPGSDQTPVGTEPDPVPTTVPETTPTTVPTANVSPPAPSPPVTSPAPSSTGTNEVGVTIEGLTGHEGHQLAGILYAGNGVVDLGQEAVGGFLVDIDSDNFTTVQTVYEPVDWQVSPVPPEGLFPYVTEDVLKMEPGVYTLIFWVDHGFTPFTRWVPINTDNDGLLGCQHVFEVSEGAQPEVTLKADFYPDGWNTACTVP